MLGYVATAFVVAIILLNLVALALAGERISSDYAVSRAATPLVAALALFFTEHFVGLGRLDWCWPLTTAASLWIVRRRIGLLRAHWRIEAVFLASFAWAFAWRFTSPSIGASSEKLADLAMIVSYRPGTRLPPEDAWFPPYPFDVYYSAQHYSAALLGRLFGLGPGVTYNLAFCLLVALTLTAATAAVYTVCRSAGRTALVVAAFALGGTGATIPVHFMTTTPPQLHSSMRFIGDAATVGHVNTPFGRSLLGRAALPSGDPLKLPSETFAYLTALGDYHPPMSGFFLLAVALLCIARLEAGGEDGPDSEPEIGPQSRAAHALLAATIPVCAVANGWSLPLQVLLVVTWAAQRCLARRPVEWTSLLVGLLGATTLCYPFLSTFAYRAADYGVRFRVVARGEHTPTLLGAIVLSPVIAAVVVPVVFGNRRRWALWTSLLWAALLVLSEVWYVDDVYSGVFNRFNTTLKWWPWIQAGALLTAGAYGIRRSAPRVLRYATVVMLASVTVYGLDLGRALFTGPTTDLGRLDGAFAITSDPIERVILEYLKAQPPAIVLQRLQAGAYTAAPAVALHAGQRAFLGWPEHEKLWRGGRVDVQQRDAEVRRFFAGEMEGSAEWLVQNRIDHVLWLKSEATLPTGTFEAIDRRVRAEYFWREYYRVGDFRVGLWSRRLPDRSAHATEESSAAPNSR